MSVLSVLLFSLKLKDFKISRMSTFGTLVSFFFAGLICVGIGLVLMLYICIFICQCGIKTENQLSQHISSNITTKNDDNEGQTNNKSKSYHVIILVSIIISSLYIYGIFYVTYLTSKWEYYCFVRTLRMYIYLILYNRHNIMYIYLYILFQM